VEMLVLSAEGKLIVRTSMEDSEKPERKERFDAWKDWLDRVRNQSDDNPAGGTDKLFIRPGAGRRPDAAPGNSEK
jgi:hypothetical protein